jgi:hypothetical protein
MSERATSQCYYCGEAKDKTVDEKGKGIIGNYVVYDLEPCETCAKNQEGYIFCVETKNKGGVTGDYALIAEDLFKRLFDEEIPDRQYILVTRRVMDKLRAIEETLNEGEN